MAMSSMKINKPYLIKTIAIIIDEIIINIFNPPLINRNVNGNNKKNNRNRPTKKEIIKLPLLGSGRPDAVHV